MTVASALDVVVVKAEDGSLRSTEFHVRFHFSSLQSGALAMLGLNPSADWEAGSSAFTRKTGGAVPREHTEHEVNRMGVIGVYCNGQLCQDVFVCAKSSNHGMVHFLEGDADGSSGGEAMDRGEGSDSGPGMGSGLSCKGAGTVRPSSATLSKLGLNDGENMLEFRMVSESEYVDAGNPRLGGEGSGSGNDSGSGRGSSTAPVMASVSMSLFVYSPRERLVVFDIDGTITRADVRGYLESVYMDRYDFVHDGVADFMTHLTREHKNVHFIYVTSRPLEHLSHTRKLLSQNQGPPGPVFMNPESLAAALVQEAVLKRSASMKTRYLADIRAVFTASSRTSSPMDTPFVLGFGNRDSDDQAYRKGALLSGQGVYIVDTNSVLRGEGGAVYTDGYRCTRLRAQLASVLGS